MKRGERRARDGLRAEQIEEFVQQSWAQLKSGLCETKIAVVVYLCNFK